MFKMMTVASIFFIIPFCYFWNWFDFVLRKYQKYTSILKKYEESTDKVAKNLYLYDSERPEIFFNKISSITTHYINTVKTHKNCLIHIFNISVITSILVFDMPNTSNKNSNKFKFFFILFLTILWSIDRKNFTTFNTRISVLNRRNFLFFMTPVFRLNTICRSIIAKIIFVFNSIKNQENGSSLAFLFSKIYSILFYLYKTIIKLFGLIIFKSSTKLPFNFSLKYIITVFTSIFNLFYFYLFNFYNNNLYYLSNKFLTTKNYSILTLKTQFARKNTIIASDLWEKIISIVKGDLISVLNCINSVSLLLNNSLYSFYTLFIRQVRNLIFSYSTWTACFYKNLKETLSSLHTGKIIRTNYIAMISFYNEWQTYTINTYTKKTNHLMNIFITKSLITTKKASDLALSIKGFVYGLTSRFFSLRLVKYYFSFEDVLWFHSEVRSKLNYLFRIYKNFPVQGQYLIKIVIIFVLLSRFVMTPLMYSTAPRWDFYTTRKEYNLWWEDACLFYDDLLRTCHRVFCFFDLWDERNKERRYTTTSCAFSFFSTFPAFMDIRNDFYHGSKSLFISSDIKDSFILRKVDAEATQTYFFSKPWFIGQNDSVQFHILNHEAINIIKSYAINKSIFNTYWFSYVEERPYLKFWNYDEFYGYFFYAWPWVINIYSPCHSYSNFKSPAYISGFHPSHKIGLYLYEIVVPLYYIFYIVRDSFVIPFVSGIYNIVLLIAFFNNSVLTSPFNLLTVITLGLFKVFKTVYVFCMSSVYFILSGLFGAIFSLLHKLYTCIYLFRSLPVLFVFIAVSYSMLNYFNLKSVVFNNLFHFNINKRFYDLRNTFITTSGLGIKWVYIF